MAIQLFVHKGRLHQRLTVVEHAVHLDGGDVLAQRRELALLNRAYLALRIEHIDVDAVNAEEAVGNGRTRVATGSHEDVYRSLSFFLFPLSSDKVLQQTRHKACADILEGEGGTMEELQGIDVVLHLDYRTVER